MLIVATTNEDQTPLSDHHARPEPVEVKQRGGHGYVPVAPLIEHLNELVSLGMTQGQIAMKAGVSENRCSYILSGKLQTVQRRTYDALMAVHYERTFDDTARHPLAPAQRRIGALQRIGWTQKDIAERAGITQGNLNQIMNFANRKFVTSLQAVGIETVYEQLSETEGPRPLAKRTARRAGYAPPQAYEPGELDDPDPARTVLVFRRWEKAHPPTRGELFYDLIEQNDYTLPEFAKALGVEAEAIRGWVSELRRPRTGLYKKACELLNVTELPILAVQATPRPHARVGGKFTKQTEQD